MGDYYQNKLYFIQSCHCSKMTENFKVENNHFSCDLSLSLSSLLASSSLCDVTLICEDGHLAAHKVILAATSSFFHHVFKLKDHNHPLIYLRGIKTVQMKAVLDFLYSGVVNVTEEGVDEFLGVANDLKIEGLMVKYQQKRKIDKKVNNDKEQKYEKNGLSNTAMDTSSNEFKLTNSKKRKTTKRSNNSKEENEEEEEHSAEDLTSEDEDVGINQNIKEIISDAQEPRKKIEETDNKKPKRKYTKRVKKTEAEPENNKTMTFKKQNVDIQSSLPRSIFPKPHPSHNLTTML